MTDNETQRLARQWAERAKNSKYFDEYADDAAAAVELVLATTTPLTMADVDWDWEKHYLAGATNEIGDVECVMIAPMDGMIVNAELGDGRLVRTSTVALTPNGKRYELREVGAPEQPEHPATLTTLEDYEDAPVGTIVVTSGTSGVLTKVGGKWKYGAYEDEYNEGMATFEREVLRWGWGK